MLQLARPRPAPLGLLAPLAGLAGAGLVAAVIALSAPATALAILLGALLVAALLRRPDLGIFLLIPAVPFQSLRSFTLGPFPASVTELLVAFTLFAWTLRLLLARRHTLAPMPLLPPLLLFLTGIALSFLPIAAAPADQGSLVWGFKELVKWLELAAVYVLATNLLTTRRHLQVAAGLLVASASAEALIGLAQSLLRRGPPSFLIHGLFLRAYGTFDQPNPFAGYLNLSLLLALALAVAYGRRPAGRWAALAAALMLAAIVASLSRGAWLALAVAALVLLDRGGRRSRLLLALGGAAVLIAAWLFAIHLLPASLTTRVETAFAIADVDVLHPTPATFSAAQRLAFWIAGRDMFLDHWLLGVGMGNFGVAYPRYALPGWNLDLAHAHDYYLNQAVETGVVGLGTYLVFLVAALRRLWRLSGTLRDPFLRAVAVGALGMLLTLSVHNALDDLYVHGTVVQIAILLAIAGVAARLDTPATAGESSGERKPGCAAAHPAMRQIPQPRRSS